MSRAAIMPPGSEDKSEWDDDDFEESPDDEFVDDDEPTVPCPYCRREILEDAERCPYCENYISSEDAPPAIHPRWIVVAAVLSLIAICWWLVV